jgi:hypothetical protein
MLFILLVSCGLCHCVQWHAHFGVFLWPKCFKNWRSCAY